jgi:hypothetical protein
VWVYVRTRRFDGVWHDGRIKCGTYSEIEPSAPGTLGVLPNIELADADAVANAAMHEALENT